MHLQITLSPVTAALNGDFYQGQGILPFTLQFFWIGTWPWWWGCPSRGGRQHRGKQGIQRQVNLTCPRHFPRHSDAYFRHHFSNIKRKKRRSLFCSNTFWAYACLTHIHISQWSIYFISKEERSLEATVCVQYGL